MADAHESHTATTLKDGRVLVLAPRLRHNTASLLPDGRVLIAGGRDAYANGAALNTAEIFDYRPASGTVAISPKTGAPTETVGSRGIIAPLVAGGVAVIAAIVLMLIRPPLVRRWRRRRGIEVRVPWRD